MAEVRRAHKRALQLVEVGAAAVVLLAVVVIPAYLTVPRRNNGDPHVDALLVLGSPTEMDGTLTHAQRWRVDEAVREYRAGRARYVLFTGGPTSHGFVEADTMARYAMQQGVPAAAVLEERTAMTTVENIRHSQPILDAEGLRRVEVISTAEHLPRAALLLEHSHLLWQTHAAPTPGRSRLQEVGAYAEEAIGTALMRCFGLGIVPVLHGLDMVQRGILLALHWIFWKTAGFLKRI